MTLFTFTLFTGLVLLALGGLFFTARPGWRKAVEGFGRNEIASYVTMGVGGLWFLYKIANLSPADELFGPATRPVLLVLFGVTWAGSFFVVKDFLSVRGLSVLILMSAATGIGLAFGRYELPSRLILVSVLYILIVLAIWFGVSPYRWRDFFQWLFAGAGRPRVFGAVLAASGLLVAGSAFTF